MENTKDMKYMIDSVGKLNLQPNNIMFYNSKGKCVGTLHLDDPIWFEGNVEESAKIIWFEGNVEESAKILLDEVIKEYINWRNLNENK